MTGVIAQIPKFQFSSAAGAPLVGGTLSVYLAGTTAPADTWQDSALTIANTNPVTLDSRGECVLWLDSAKSYKFALKNAAGVPQWTEDNIAPGYILTAMASPSGATLIGANAYQTQHAVNLENLSVAAYGAVGSGIDNDGASITSALNSGICRLDAGKTYDLGGASITITNSVELVIGRGAVIKNGYLQLRPTDAAKTVTIRGHLQMGALASVRITGAYTASETDPLTADSKAITLICDDITATSKYPGASASILIYSIKNSRIGNLRATGTAMLDTLGAIDTDAKGLYLSDWWDSAAGDLTADGDYAMGVEVDHGSTRAAYSFCRCSIRDVFARKPVAFVDFSGFHGFYFHGAYKTSVRHVRGIGWGGNVASSADFKHRDNFECVIESADVGRMRFTADNNYSFFAMISEGNEIRRLTASISISTAATTPGLHLNNRLGNVSTPVASLDGNNGGSRGFILYGRCDLGGSAGTINVGSVSFEDCRLSLTGSPALTGNNLFMRSVESFSPLVFTPNAPSLVKLRAVHVEGEISIAPLSGTSIHTLDYASVTATGEIKVNSFDPRVVNAIWRDVVSDMPEPIVSLRPDSQKYRNVVFSDVAYTLRNT